MKKTSIFILIALSILNANSQNKLVDSNNDFAFKIYISTKPDSANYFISPFSLNIALSIANEGARGSTRDELDKLLSIKDIDTRATSYKNLIDRTTNLKDSSYFQCIRWTGDKSDGNALFIANSLWINRDSKIEESYIKTIENNYYSEIFDFDKNNISTENQKLNDWISDKTKNKINEIKGLDSTIKLSIINAIYFKGEWENPFKKKKTKEKIFYSLNHDRVKKDFMNNQTHYSYYEDSDIQGINLPYHCKQLSMLVLLPKERYGINLLEQKLNIEYFQQIQQSCPYKEVILTLPKFKIESEIYPMNDISKMGYPIMFSPKADFTKISQVDSLRIGSIVHKTFVEIDEKKTEAAALTEVIMVGYGGIESPPPPPPPKIFNANHPFIFIIIDNRTRAILFMGRFVN